MSVNAQDLVDEVFAKYGTAAVLADVTRRLIAFSVQPVDVADIRRSALMDRTQKHSSDWDWLVAHVRPDDEIVHTPAAPTRRLAPRTIVPLRARDVIVAYLIAVDPEGRITAEDVAHLRPILTAIALEVEFERAESVRRRTVVAALLSNDEDERGQAADALHETHSLDSQASVRVVTARIPGARDGSVADTHWNLIAGTRGLVTNLGHNLVAVLVDRQAMIDIFCERVLRVGALSTADPRIGVGDSVLGLDNAYRSYRQAKRALSLAVLGIRAVPVLRWDQLGSWRALLTIRPADAIDAIDPRVLALVRSEDPELVATVRDYLERGGEIAALAAERHIHRTTLYGRLKRLSAAYGIDWGNPDERATALIGFRIAQLHPVRRDAD